MFAETKARFKEGILT